MFLRPDAALLVVVSVTRCLCASASRFLGVLISLPRPRYLLVSAYRSLGSSVPRCLGVSTSRCLVASVRGHLCLGASGLGVSMCRPLGRSLSRGQEVSSTDIDLDENTHKYTIRPAMRLIRCVHTTMSVCALYDKLLCAWLVSISVRSVQSTHLYTRCPAYWSMCDDQDVMEIPMRRPLGSSLCLHQEVSSTDTGLDGNMHT